jgi:hypothetical protein
MRIFDKLFRKSMKVKSVIETQKDTGVQRQLKQYYNKEWNFSITYPVDWEILCENKSVGSWVMAIVVAGKERSGGRPGLIVNVRRGEILRGSSNVTVFSIGKDGETREEPRTPQEYVERSKEDLRRSFPGFQFLSAEEISLVNKPAVREVYSYNGDSGRIQEECITLFGVGITFQFTCEAPINQFTKIKPIFDSIIGSFRIGREPSEEPSKTDIESAVIPEKQSPLQMYNSGAALYRSGEFKRAMKTFDRCFRSGEYQMQSAYARGLCQKELGLDVEIPEELGDRAEDAGPVYVASNLACYLIGKGYRAALTKQGSTSEVTADIEGSLYVISISSLFGGFNNWVWRKEGEKNISVADPSVNPNPTATDKFVVSLVKEASSLPLSPLPKDGLKSSLK